ncbi:ATP-binding protein [Streptomyces sp. NPDC008222]|uniref:ATP-binding protein n=1 Tax=Streptomyces sp. NPDC008222 TaxID=3364820 RepID=UPI0036E46561
MRCRDEEWRLLGELLRRARNGSGGVFLVDGERGMGKSHLLREAGCEAAAQGFSLAAGAADRLGEQIPLFALQTALGVFGDDEDVPEPVGRSLLTGRLREQLVLRAETAPVVVALDDLHWASRETLLALRILPRELARFPIVWVLSRSVVGRNADAESLFSALEREGAFRVTLRPLDEGAITATLVDAFGAPPDDRLLGLAKGAGGNPALLADLVVGLREENLIRMAGSRACLAAARLPRRIPRAARPWLEGVGESTRRLLSIAAVLGGEFRLGDVARVLGAAPAELLPGIEEALDARIIAADEDTFSFRHGLIARAAAESVPRPVRRALHRQFGEVLLGHERSVAEAAGHLLRGASPDDPGSLTALDNGAGRALRRSPEAAADLALRAWQLTDPADQAAIPRAVRAAEALTASGRAAQAAQIVHEALAHPLPAELEARLRSALASILNMSGQAGDATGQAEKALAASDRGDVHSHALEAWLEAATARGEDRHSGRIVADVLSRPTDHAEHVVLAARTAQAMFKWNEGHVAEALELLRETVRQGHSASPDSRRCRPLLLLAARLIDLRRIDEATAIIRSTDDRGPSGRLTYAILSVLRARLHLIGGRLDEAGAEAQTALDAAESVGADAYAAVARSLLALVASRQGRLHDAAHHLAGRTVLPPHAASVYAYTETVLTVACVTETREGPSAVISHIRKLCADPVALRRVLLGDPTAAVWMVRTAMAAGDHHLANKAALAVEGLASPANPYVKAAAAHAGGFLAMDEELLVYATTHNAGPWACASAAEDLGLLHLGRAARDQAVQCLNEALDGYGRTGATADMARVRARLRGLGIRRRHWEAAPDRPADGWDSLTNTERAVSELIAQGLTNQQAANRMYISVHTVAHHLRQTFRKLSIGSRVELARIVVERSQRA